MWFPLNASWHIFSIIRGIMVLNLNLSKFEHWNAFNGWRWNWWGFLKLFIWSPSPQLNPIWSVVIYYCVCGEKGLSECKRRGQSFSFVLHFVRAVYFCVKHTNLVLCANLHLFVVNRWQFCWRRDHRKRSLQVSVLEPCISARWDPINLNLCS